MSSRWSVRVHVKVHQQKISASHVTSASWIPTLGTALLEMNESESTSHFRDPRSRCLFLHIPNALLHLPCFPFDRLTIRFLLRDLWPILSMWPMLQTSFYRHIFFCLVYKLIIGDWLTLAHTKNRQMQPCNAINSFLIRMCLTVSADKLTTSFYQCQVCVFMGPG